MKTIHALALAIALMGSRMACGQDASAAGTEAEKAMMEKMMKLNAPSDAHKALEPFVGKWTFTSQMTMGAGAPPMSMDGTAENTLIYGGRFLKEKVNGTWQGEPFEGLGYLGHDNVKDEYESIWMDSTMTGIMRESGTYDAATKTLKFSGENSCPMTGEKARAASSETRLIDNDHYTYTSTSTGPDGEEMKMEIKFTRAP